MPKSAKIAVLTPPLAVIPIAAAEYSVRELASRAGVTPELFATWQVRCDEPGWLDVYVLPGTRRRLRFPMTTHAIWHEISRGEARMSRATWCLRPGVIGVYVPEFIVPFSSSDLAQVGPLFSPTLSDSIVCPVDLPLSILLTLSRYEETLHLSRDAHERFSAIQSMAVREGFLYRPIVDEYGLALAQVLPKLLPGWRPAKRALRICVSHDVDEIGVPFKLRNAIGHTLRRGNPLATVRDLVRYGAGGDTSYMALLRRITEASQNRGIVPAVYWKAANASQHDTGYDPHGLRLHRLIREQLEQGIEVGVHPSYVSFRSPRLLNQEVGKLREILGDARLGGRQDYLRWEPETWSQWESAGLAYDSSVGYADAIGFRAGTCHPYRPWLMKKQREARLWEVPLTVMDSAALHYLKLSAEETVSQVRSLIERCRTVGGVFTLAWHNTRIMQRAHSKAFLRILDSVAGELSFNWEEVK